MVLNHHPTPADISTIDQTLVKAFGNTCYIIQGWEIPLGMTTILKHQSPSNQRQTKLNPTEPHENMTAE